MPRVPVPKPHSAKRLSELTRDAEGVAVNADRPMLKYAEQLAPRYLAEVGIFDNAGTLFYNAVQHMVNIDRRGSDESRSKRRTRLSRSCKPASGCSITSRTGYDNVEVFGPDGRRSHVERRINVTQAAVVRQIYQLAAEGYGKKAIAKMLNEAGAICPRPQQGRPRSWAPSSVFEVLNRPLYRGEVAWNQSQKGDTWGRHRQRARPAREWVRLCRMRCGVRPKRS